jgi:thiol:disulfide interchange protein DsbD
MMTRLFLILGICVLVAFPAQSQIQNPVSWKYSVVKVANSQYTLKLTAKIEPKWHLYSQHIGQDGPIPTSFSFEKSEKYTLEGKVKELSKVEVIFDSSFMMQLKYFSHEAVFQQKIKVVSGDAFQIKGSLEFMSCNDHQCLPSKKVNFSFDIPASKIASSQDTDTKNLASDTTSIATKSRQGTTDSTKKTLVNTPPTLQPLKSTSDDSSLWQFFLIAFGAGFLGLFTPCVYPMIPMTVSFFMRDEKKKFAGIFKGVIFGLSIIFIYTMLGVILALTKSSADVTNYISSNWIPNLIFFLLFVVFAISFFGAFELVLPGSLANKIDKQVDKGGYAAAFFMALTLVVVSFSCTAPFVGSILVEASRGIAIKPIIGMFGYSLAFAIPFMIFAISPTLLKQLAKSGSWLNAVKVVMAFILLIFSLKFLLAIDTTHHFNILTREVYLSIWIVLFTMLGFYLLGKLKLAHDSDLPHIGVFRLFLAIITFSFVVYLIPGLFGAPLNAFSSMLPPASKQSVFNAGGVSSSNQQANLCETPKYDNILHLPFGMNGYFDYQQGIACAQKLNKPIFLDFKGHTCANCKKMEGGVFSNPEILQRLRNDFVIVALYTDDTYKLPESEWVKSAYDGEVKKTMGEKNLDFQIAKFKSNTQPLYAIINSTGDTLTSPMAFTMNVDAFKKFLDNGKKKFLRK